MILNFRCFNLDEYQLLDALENITRTWPGYNPNCTNLDQSEIRTGRRSFPSGHASISTATWLFLCLRYESYLGGIPRFWHFILSIHLILANPIVYLV